MSNDVKLLQDVHWDIQYKVKLGRAWSRFLDGLKHGKLLGTTCSTCSRTYVPAQDYCESCFEAITEWREVEPVGTLRAVTIVYQGFDGGPEAPYATGAIELDDTGLLFIHFLDGLDLSNEAEARAKLVNGARVKAVWAPEEQRNSEITDIAYFELV
jgi:uncharacterized protein